MTDRYTVPIQEDSNGDLIIVFPEELMEDLDWNIGDSLKWKQNDDGSWSLEKHEDSNTE